MVPGEDLVLAGRPIRPPGPVALGIVLVVVFVIGQQAVVGPGRRAGVGAIAVAVVLVVLADLAGVCDARDLARLVVLECAGAVDGGLRDRPAQRVVAPGVAVDFGPGTVANVLPFGQPAGQVVRGGRLGDDLGTGDVGRPMTSKASKGVAGPTPCSFLAASKRAKGMAAAGQGAASKRDKRAKSPADLCSLCSQPFWRSPTPLCSLCSQRFSGNAGLMGALLVCSQGIWRKRCRPLLVCSQTFCQSVGRLDFARLLAVG